ncbi:MAG: hypothetical protein NTX75_02055 [Proteobacteria bacterium]|nr:hypothetical protein [Pseudomonadota bacterium]
MSRIVLLLFVVMLLSACSDPSWEHPSGFDKKRLMEDTMECKVYARDMAKGQSKNIKMPAATPHAGVAEAFIVYGMFQDLFVNCMEAKGWTKVEK